MGVAGYYRVSKARDGMHSPELYEGEIDRYCRYHDLVLAEIYCDIDYSGRTGSRTRPALERLRGERQKYSAVVIPKLSRFGRSMKDLIRLFDEFDADSVPLIFLDMNIDTSTSQGRLLRHVMSAFAEYESDVKSDYARANRQLAWRAGKQWTGNVPYGYLRGTVDTASYFPHPERAPVVLEIYERYLAGESAMNLTREMNRRGERTSKGAYWRTRNIMMILERPSNAALIRTSDGDLLPGNWQPLVPRALWDAVQAKIKAAKRPGKPPPRWHLHLLTQLLVCGVCGRRLYHRPSYSLNKQTGRYVPNEGLYKCNERERFDLKQCPGGGIRSARAERIVVDAFLTREPFIVARSKQFPFEGVMNTREAWDALALAERRKLLSLAIERIVLLPRGPVSGAGTLRTLVIEWVDKEEPGHGPLTMRIEESISPARRLSPRQDEVRRKRQESQADWRAMVRASRFPDLQKSPEILDRSIATDDPRGDPEGERHASE